MSVSVVIPLYGGRQEIRDCLSSLALCRGLIDEVIVVDDASPDDAPSVVEEFQYAKLIRHSKNLGFSAACNTGYRSSTGDVVIFLNSDTVVPRIAVQRMLESLGDSTEIGAVGPVSNSAFGPQEIEVSYRSPEEMHRFAEGFAQRNAEDEDTDLLIGFCLAVRRTALDEVGDPFDERFGIGLFEDNDLSYRLRREGYRLVVSKRAFVHHSGSATFNRENVEKQRLMRRNQEAFFSKWHEDLLLGFSNGLSGFVDDSIRFVPDRKPEAIRAQLADLAESADISLCMIVRNEEASLGEALRTAAPFFRQVVVVDTGSTDRTVEIAREAGAQVHYFQWIDDFSAARNESLCHAQGKWIFWMDADDTLSLASAEALILEAIEAPPEIGAFLVPHQFLDEKGVLSTRVDHVKLFRNLPNIRFEGRLHEQVLPSIEAAGIGIARSRAVVLHSAYDLSREGQERKLERDWRILSMELQERPNHPFVLFNAAMTAWISGRYEEAITYAQRSIEESDAQGLPPMRKAFVIRVVCLMELGRDEEALKLAFEGLARLGDDPELHFYTGALLTTQNRLREALEHFEAVERTPPQDFTSVDVSMLTYQLWHNAGTVCMRLGRYDDAKRWLMRAVEQSAEGPSAQVLFMAAIQQRDWNTAQGVLQKAEAQAPLSETWSMMFMVLEEAQKGQGSGERALRKIARANPSEPGPRLAICQRMLHTGRAPEALRDLAVMAESGIPEAAIYISMAEEQSGEFESALDWMRRAEELDPGNAVIESEVKRLEGLRVEG